MTRTTPWWDYVQRLMDRRGLRPADLANLSGVDQSVIGRWRDRGAQPSPDNVRKIARAFEQSVAQAAVLAGHYSAAELGEDRGGVVNPDTFDLAVISDERMRDDVYDRMRGRPAHRGAGHEPAHTTTDTRPMPAHRATSIGGRAADDPEAVAR